MLLYSAMGKWTFWWNDEEGWSAKSLRQNKNAMYFSVANLQEMICYVPIPENSFHFYFIMTLNCGCCNSKLTRRRHYRLDSRERNI